MIPVGGAVGLSAAFLLASMWNSEWAPATLKRLARVRRALAPAWTNDPPAWLSDAPRPEWITPLTPMPMKPTEPVGAALSPPST